jgi:hypothetical protein
MTFEGWWKDFTKDKALYSFPGTVSFPEAAAKAAWEAAQAQDQLEPNWEDAPEWANYFAKDRDERWFWFEHEPLINHAISCWTRKTDGRIQLAIDNENSWKQSLRKRP